MSPKFNTVKLLSDNELLYLKKKTIQLRKDILKMLNKSGSGHTGGSLSIVELLTVLFYSEMKHDPANPKWQGRDRFILSKGHAAPALYAVLADTGYFEKEELNHLRKLEAMLQGHPDSLTTPGIEISTGSLGQGLGIANGIALSLRLDNSNSRVYALLGDGEIQEGLVWESAMSAGHYKLSNLTAILDNNNLQIDGEVKDIMTIYPVADKFRSFNWNVIEIDGHDLISIKGAIKIAEKTTDKPTMIIAHTIKGKGISIFENKVKYHGITPTDEELAIALKELDIQEQEPG